MRHPRFLNIDVVPSWDSAAIARLELKEVEWMGRIGVD